MTPFSAAFLPLTDSAILVAAREKGFAADAGIDLDLVRCPSWATVRDRLVYGQVQGAQLLAPLAVAMSLGLRQAAVPIAAPFKLGLNGNALTLAPDLAVALDPDPRARIADPLAAAHDFAAAIGLHRRKPVIGVVHRFSSHALMLRYWLGYAGIDPDRDISLRVLPPSKMVEALRCGEIDGFIAGEPWSSVAVDAGVGEIVAIGAHIWQRGVEKLLGLRANWAADNADVVDRLVRALDGAARWCDDPVNRPELAAILARAEYIDQPAGVIERGLTGRLWLRRDAVPVQESDFLLFHRDAANFPWRSQGLWIYSQFVRWGFIAAGVEAESIAADVFRSDIYRRALAGGATPLPSASLKVEGALGAPVPVGAGRQSLTLGPDRFFDGRIFDPAAISDYLAGFAPFGRAV